MQTHHRWITGSGLSLLLACTVAGAATGGPDLLFTNAQGTTALSATDRQAIYDLLGLNTGADGKSLEFADGGGCPPLMPGGDTQVQGEDLNQDQQPEVIVSLGSTCMYGMAGMGVSLFTRDGSGHWKLHNLGSGIAVVQDTRHKGYADLMIGGPGFCQPVLRWNGTTYVFDHHVPEQPGGCDGR
jgi:hypothetical protein